METRFIVILFSLLSLSSYGQKDTAFMYTYGGLQNDGCSQIRPTTDKGYILIGYTTSYGTQSNSLYAVKIDSLCRPQWSRAFGTRQIQVGYSVTPTFDKGYAFAGFTDNNPYGYDGYLVKTDSNGIEQWEKTYGGNDWDFIYSIKQTSDSGFVMCGQTYSYGSGNGNVYVIRTDKNGDTLWTKAIGGWGCDVGNDILIRNDSLYVIVGSTTSFGNADTNVYFLELNSSGKVVTSKTYGSKYTSIAKVITPTNDGGYMITGSIDSIFKDVAGELLLKTDSTGNCQWMTQATNGKWNDRGQDIIEASDTTYLSIGSSDGGGYGSSSVHIMHHNATGFYLAGPSIGGNNAQFGSSVTIGANGNVLFAGATSSYGQGGFDMYVIRIKNDSMAQNYAQVISSYAAVPVFVSVPPQPINVTGIKVFPNPAKLFTTFIVQGIGEENYRLNIVNELGQAVLPKTAFSHTYHGQSVLHINTSNFPTGVYFYNIYNEQNRVGSGKLIVE